MTTQTFLSADTYLCVTGWQQQPLTHGWRQRADVGHRGAQFLSVPSGNLFAATKKHLYLHINICGCRQVMLSKPAERQPRKRYRQ